VILDVDTGTDDAVAVMAAALHPDLDLVAVTTVNGNVPVDVATENTLRVLDHVGADVAVHEGAARPMVRPDFPVPRAGSDLLDRMHGRYLDLPPARTAKRSRSAVAFLIDHYLGPHGPDTILVPTGPLTNIALAVATAPEIVARIPRIVLMGGSHKIGNVTPSAEFNVWADPEAARVVLRCGARDILVVPLDCTHQTVVSAADCDRLAALATPAAQAASALIRHRIAAHDASQPLDVAHTAAVHDAVCVASLARPDVLRDVGRYHVDVETGGELCVGRTVVDTHRRGGREPNARVALGGDPRVLVDFLIETFSITHASR
jgi:inosine-uridine nucleoside N-ribohydrolase